MQNIQNLDEKKLLREIGKCLKLEEEYTKNMYDKLTKRSNLKIYMPFLLKLL